MKIGTLAWWAAQAAGVFAALNIQGPSDTAAQKQLQDLVTWDERSIFIRGERIIVFAGEFHPFRAPSPSLWLDTLQKIRALGMNAVSIYIDWALLEGKQGQYRADGVFALEPFFEAATKAGLYVIARPGPYINAEVSGGGFPGWLTRINGTLRTRDKAYLEATDNYMANVGKAIAAAQITNGGPVILFQYENEYSSSTRAIPFPDREYMQHVIDQARAAGIVVPMINNDVNANGNLVADKGLGAPDIYGHDAYFWGTDDCHKPDVWRTPDFSFGPKHKDLSPASPFAIVEFQAGVFINMGGPGYDTCASLLNADFISVFYRTAFGMGAKLLGAYMVAGGTNWGNLGNDGSTTSYDYAAAIREDRRVDRSKYAELKLVANFIRASTPALVLAVPDNGTAAAAWGPGDEPLEVDRLSVPVSAAAAGQPQTQFFTVRHRNASVATTTTYSLSVRSSRGLGTIDIPRQGGRLTLRGRDAKIHVVDYDAGGVDVVYCTADIFTWKRLPGGRVLLIVYGGVGEHHEIGIAASAVANVGNDPDVSQLGNTLVSDGIISFSWEVTEAEKREMIRLGSLDIMLLNRNQARAFWVLDIAGSSNSTAKVGPTDGAIIVKGGYLIRSAALDGPVLRVQGDFDRTATLEFMGVPPQATSLSVNGNSTNFSVDATTGFWKTTVLHWAPELRLPKIGSAEHEWRYVDALPEVRPGYDDSAWPRANLTRTPNIAFPRLGTPVSLYAADYGFHSGYLLYRGTFAATGNETGVTIETQGGLAFGSAVWLDDTFLGSWPGDAGSGSRESAFAFPQPVPAGRHTITVLIDSQGHELNLMVGSDAMKRPRGILGYSFNTTSPGPQPAVDWALTGNLGGEDYADAARGPLNEGGLFAERQGWHLPRPPSSGWAARHPVHDGVAGPGVGFFATRFALNMPRGFDTPLYLVLANSTGSDTGGSGGAPNGTYYRAQLYVNGWQVGRYVSHLGPQAAFHVPEGILDYRGDNWLAVSLWAQRPGGARLAGLALSTAPGSAGPDAIMTGFQNVTLVESPPWRPRPGAY